MFRLIGLVLVATNLLVWLRLRTQLVRAFPASKPPLWLFAAGFALLFYPSLSTLVAGVSGLRWIRSALPEWLLMGSMGVQFAAWFCLVFMAVGGLARVLGRGARWAYQRLAPARAEPQAESGAVDTERREFVAKTALALPAVAVAVSAGGVIASRQAPAVVRVQLPVRRELTALHGVTIAQISDVHVGSYMDAERLREIRDAVNALKADYHVITGDLIDNDESQLELSTWLIRGLAPRRGEKFLCIGNHEYIAARTCELSTLVRGLEDAGGQLLVDEARKVRVGGDHLWLGGIDYPPSPRFGHMSGRSTRQSLQHVLAQITDDGAPRIVLSHHPRTFVQARHMPIDLMLSGHTHGGQIVLGRVGEHALTPMTAFEHYHNGLYEYAGRRLYVNAGAGGWLPVRINCPPEITLVELVSA